MGGIVQVFGLKPKKRGGALPSTPADEHTVAQRHTQPALSSTGGAAAGIQQHLSTCRLGWLANARRDKTAVKISCGFVDAAKTSATASPSPLTWH